MSVPTELRRLALDRGRRNEVRVVEAIEMLATEWITGVRLATKTEDHNGIDVVVSTTDVGDLYLQVKSSKAEARRWKARRNMKRAKHIGMIVALSQLDDMALSGVARSELARLRSAYLATRSGGSQ